VADGQLTTDTDLWPAYTDKDDLLEDLYHANTPEDLRQIGYRVGNTNLSAISNPTRTMIAWEVANLS